MNSSPTVIMNSTLPTILTNHPGTGEIIVGCIVYSIIIILSLLGNVMVVIAILRVQKLRHPTNFILMSLAIADLLVSTTVMIPGFIYEIKQEWIFGKVFCNIWLSNDITFCTASILHIAAVSFDRYVAIEYPLKYKQKMTKWTILKIIGSIWLISVLMSYAPVFLDLYSRSRAGTTFNPSACRMEPNLIYSIVSSSLSFSIPLIIILCLYGRIFIIARKHSHELQKLENIIKRLHSNQKFVLENAKWKKNIKAIRTLGIVVGVFIACWLPFFVIYVLGAYCECVHPNVERYITWIGYVNSFCNPVIYAFSNKEFRNAFFEILHYNDGHCLCLSSKHPPRTSISKSTHSMKLSPINQSRQTSMTPCIQPNPHNGHLSQHDTSSSLCTPLLNPNHRMKKTESTDTFEMQIFTSQRRTLEAFEELEQLVGNGSTGRASIVQMSSLVQD